MWYVAHTGTSEIKSSLQISFQILWHSQMSSKLCLFLLHFMWK